MTATDGTQDLIRFGEVGRQRKYHLMRSAITCDPADMKDPMLCGARSRGLPRCILSVDYREWAEREGRVCARCLTREGL